MGGRARREGAADDPEPRLAECGHLESTFIQEEDTGSRLWTPTSSCGDS